MSELYVIVLLRRVILVCFLVQYIVTGLVHMRLFFKIKGKNKVELKRWMILFLILY